MAAYPETKAKPTKRAQRHEARWMLEAVGIPSLSDSSIDEILRGPKPLTAEEARHRAEMAEKYPSYEDEDDMA